MSFSFIYFLHIHLFIYPSLRTDFRTDINKYLIITNRFINIFNFNISSLLFFPHLQLNPDVNVFQRKFVNEVRRCEEMDRKLSKWADVWTFG